MSKQGSEARRGRTATIWGSRGRWASAYSPVTDPNLPPRDPAADDLPPDAPMQAADPTPEVDPAPETPVAAAAAPEPQTPPAPRLPRDLTVVGTVVAFVLGCALVVAGYVAINGGALLAAASPATYEAARMSVPRGLGRAEGGVVTAQAPANDVLIIAVATDFRARDLATIAWDVTGLPANADVRLLFSSDYTPRRVHNRALTVENGHVRPIALAGDRDWLGRITGLALAIRAPGATIRVRSVSAKPLSLGQLLSDRAREWFRDEPWTGTSINSVTGGAGAQNLPLPIPLMLAALIAIALVALAARLARSRFRRGIVPVAVIAFALAWALLDLRWTANLGRQVAVTLDRYGGKDTAERGLAAEEGELAAFVDKAKARMPPDPQRVLVLAHAHYFRGRASWHLLPHRVAWEPVRDLAPAAGMLHAGDYVLVWRRPGTQYDAVAERVRFDNGVELPAKALLVEHGSALFAIQ